MLALAPESTVSMLSYLAVSLFIAYVCAVVLTVYYATLQTGMVADIRDHEASLTALEHTYYDGVARVSSTDPHGQGFVTPQDVRYISARTSEGLSFAGR